MLATSTQVKTHLGISGSTYDTLLGQILAEVDAMIKKMLGRQVEETAYTDQILDGDDQFPYVQLSDFPIKSASVTSLKYNAGTTAVPNWTDVPASNYEIYYDEGVIMFYQQYEGKRNLKITYTAGGTVPKDLEMVCIRLTAKIYEKRKSEGVTSESLEGTSINWAELLTADDKAVIDNHKLFVMV